MGWKFWRALERRAPSRGLYQRSAHRGARRSRRSARPRAAAPGPEARELGHERRRPRALGFRLPAPLPKRAEVTHMPILAPRAREVAGPRADCQGRRAGVEVIQRLYLHGPGLCCRQQAVRGGVQLAAQVKPHAARTDSAVAKPALAVAQSAHHHVAESHGVVRLADVLESQEALAHSVDRLGP